MGMIQLDLCTSDGEVIGEAGEWAGNLPGVLPSPDPDTMPILSRLDPYEEVRIEHDEMMQLVEELGRLRSRARNHVQERVIDVFVEVAQKGLGHPGSYFVSRPW
jgi:hypothetical protein